MMRWEFDWALSTLLAVANARCRVLAREIEHFENGWYVWIAPIFGFADASFSSS